MTTKNIVTSLLIIMSYNCQQSNINPFPGLWELKWSESGFFPDDDLLFVKTGKPFSEYIFEFKEDGTVLHGNDDPAECPVGAFTVKDGNWKFENNTLTLELRGEKVADYWYWWIIEYSVEINKEQLWLRMKRILKNRQLPPTKTWEDLIKNNDH